MTRSGLPRPDTVLLRLRLLGRMEAVTLGNESVLPLGRKTRGLLAILALGGRKPVLRVRLAELLWSRRSEEQARASLRQEIHRLLEALSPLGTDVITVDRHTMALKPALTSVDAERILTTRCNQADSLPPIEGVLLEELNGTDPALDSWLSVERIRLRDHAVGLFEEMLSRQRDPDGMLAASRQLLALDGRHQRAWLAMIQAQQALGDVALARQFGERCLSALGAAGIEAAGPQLRGALQSLGLDHDPESRPVPHAFVPDARQEEQGAASEPHPPFEPVGTAPLSNAVEWMDHAVAQPAMPHLPDGPPMVAILPILVLDAAGDPEIANFASGLVQALQAGLVGGTWGGILSGSELEDSIAHGRDDATLRRRFGARYVVDGTTQRIGRNVRVILRLSDLTHNSHLIWAQRFDGRTDSLLVFQDTVSAQVAARLPVEITLAEAVQARRLSESELKPQQLSAIALHRLSGSDRAGNEQSLSMLSRALDVAPHLKQLHLALAMVHVLATLQRWGDADEHADHAEASARAALGTDQSNPRYLACCALVLSELRDRPDAAMALLQRAMSISPNVAEVWAVGAYALIRLGQLDEAAQFFGTYKQLFATHPFQALLDLPEVMLLLLRGENAEAARLGLLHAELRPGYVPTLVPYLAALGHLRQTAEAQRIRDRLLQSWPEIGVDMLVSRAGLRDPAHAERLRAGLVLAGLGTAVAEGKTRGATDGAAVSATSDGTSGEPARAPGGGTPADPRVDVGATRETPPRARRTRRPLGVEPLAG